MTTQKAKKLKCLFLGHKWGKTFISCERKYTQESTQICIICGVRRNVSYWYLPKGVKYEVTYNK